MSTVNVENAISNVRDSVATLSDGRWEPKRDLLALGNLFVSIGTLVLAGVAALASLGLVDGDRAVESSAQVSETTSDTLSDGEG